MSSKTRNRHFLSLSDWSREELQSILRLAGDLKADPQKYAHALEGKTLAMIFKKSSTRTRVSFEVGMFQLGGHALFMSPDATQVGRGEPLSDTARVLSRYVDGIMIRTYDQAEVSTLADFSRVPVINGLSDLLHPCQVLSDIFTVLEYFELQPDDLLNFPVAYIGDGNNMANSWISAAKIFGFNLQVACPVGFEPAEGLLQAAGGRVKIVREPEIAAAQARVLNTDVWASMGQEDEAAERKRLFQGYQINHELLSVAAENPLVLHCLPAHRGEEVTAEIFEQFADAIFTQAENRLHVQKALLITLLAN